ncbi:MAG: phosphoribosylpyrophosphate synthetase [Bacteroidetes bacterium 46-16]|nr:MAG: phosphoribosylpyrophosphate synthetase [Bacteroidetes bacterium 46-16]
METVSQVIETLRQEGYTEDLNLQQNCIECRAHDFRIFHDEFIIDKYYRFEGESDPADEATVYAVSAPKYGIKGILVNGYGVYTEGLTDEMLRSLQVKHE